jgi:hypothetical protein
MLAHQRLEARIDELQLLLPIAKALGDELL